MISQQLKHSGWQIKNRFAILINGNIQKKFATQAALKLNREPTSTKTSNISWENARPYAEIPGPTKWEFIMNLMPNGPFYKKSASEMILGYQKKYGSLMRWQGLFGKPDMILSLNPDDYAIVFRNEGLWPNRRVLDTLKYHRAVHRDDIFQGVHGVMATYDEEWAKIRSVINPILMQPKNSILYLNTMLEINDEFLQRIREIRDPLTLEMPDNFDDEINRLTLETVTAVALNTQLGIIRKNRNSEDSIAIMKNLHRFFDLLFYLEIMPSIWKYIPTPKFKEMMKVLDSITDLCSKYIDKALKEIEHDKEGKLTSAVGKERSVLEKLLKVDKKIAVVTALDMMMAGVDSTSSTIVGILLCIAKNPEKQQKLFEEVSQILPQKDSKLTIENMRNLPYLRACIKEGMRVYPIISGTIRQTSIDLVLSGYRVPAGMDVSMASNLNLNDERYVPNPKEFLPERWLRNEDNKKLVGDIETPFMFLPFGFGPRSCVGKRIVNLEMEITIARLIRNFNIEFKYSVENAFSAKFINIPAIPLKFKFEERTV